MVSRKKEETKVNGTGKGHLKFRYSDGERYLDLDMEGIASDAVADGLKSIANALAGRTVLPPARALPKSVTTAVAPEQHDDHEVPEPSPEEAIEEAPLEEIASDDGTDRPKRRSAPKAPKFLSDLDLTKASVQLADFVQKKNPGGDMERYAVIAAWFKDHLSVDEVTIDHIFTAYKALGWQSQLPDVPAQTLRNLKSNKNWFDSGSNRGAYKINWNGENAVNKMGTPEQ